MPEPIEGAAIGIGADLDRRAIVLRIDLPDGPLEILIPADTGLELAELLIAALRQLRAH
jgi:hypothetical protein